MAVMVAPTKAPPEPFCNGQRPILTIPRLIRTPVERAAQSCIGMGVISRVLDREGGFFGGGGVPVTKTPLHCVDLTVARDARRLQFADFDATYLERLQSGDARTAQHFTAYFSELIKIKLRSRLRSKEAIEDVRQETFVRVFALVRAKEGIKHPERLGALVNSVCNHVLLEHYRSNRRTDSPIDAEPESAMAADGVSAVGLLEIDEAGRLVHAILSRLPERDRRLLQSILLEERNKDEVCAELGLSREYLRVLVHRAKQAFKAVYMKRLSGAQ
jgi:RNA polymerase sigma-70 factor (ECF subfamily)